VNEGASENSTAAPPVEITLNGITISPGNQTADLTTDTNISITYDCSYSGSDADILWEVNGTQLMVGSSDLIFLQDNGFILTGATTCDSSIVFPRGVLELFDANDIPVRCNIIFEENLSVEPGPMVTITLVRPPPTTEGPTTTQEDITSTSEGTVNYTMFTVSNIMRGLTVIVFNSVQLLIVQ